MVKLDNHIKLNIGADMPVIGLGTWESLKDKVGQAVEYALLDCGYKHIDCASIYGNEKEIGQVFKNVFTGNKIKRDRIFITSKLWNDAHARQDVAVACKNTLSDLELDYLDLYLMHWGVASPSNLGKEPLDDKGVLITAKIPVRETWEAMEELQKSGLVRAIGVANFTAPMLIDLLSYAQIKPAVNQIELHPYNQQTKLVNYCHYNDIVVTAYSPLGSPANNKKQDNPPMVLQDVHIIKIARQHNKTPAQILIRWALQRGTIAIPKSVTPERIKENINVFDFELSKEEMDLLGTLDRRHRYVDPCDWWDIPYFD
jgi:alcohol dehydrogenase (NADP+)